MVRVGDVARSVSDTHHQRNGELIFLNTSDVLHGRILHHNYSAVRTMPGQAKKSVKYGDILFSEIRPANGRWALVTEPADDLIVSTKLMVVRPVGGAVDESYLYLFLTSAAVTSWLQVLADGRSGTFPQITFQQVADLEMPLPSVSVQRTIATTVGAIDAKIESNRRATDRLEALGGALLEAVVKPDTFGTPEYEPATVLGDILATLETGSRPRGGIVASSVGTVSLGAESIQSAGLVPNAEFKRVPEDFASSMKRGRLQDGDVLVYKDGGKPGNFTPHVSAFGQGFPVAEATINEHVYRVRAIEGISQGLLYWILRSPWMDREMRKRGTGVAIPGLNSSNFRDLPWPTLSESATRQLNETLAPMLVGMLRLGAQSMRLRALRDALLPELLSGRFRVATHVDASDLTNELEHA